VQCAKCRVQSACLVHESESDWGAMAGNGRLLQPQPTSCACASPLPSRITNYCMRHTTHDNATGTRPSSASMVRMANETLPMAEKVACRYAVAVYHRIPCPNTPQASISRATHSGSSKTSCMPCATVASQNIVAALTSAMSKYLVRAFQPSSSQHLPDSRSVMDAVASPYPLRPALAH
jgi:hypothetical protein